METKKLYITPSIQVVTLDTECSILAGSQLSDLGKGEDPWKFPSAAPTQSSLGTPEYFDSWVEDEEY